MSDTVETYHSDASEERRDDLTDAIRVMKEGTPISFYTSTWAGTDFRMFQLSEKNDAIIYTNVGTLGSKGTVTEERIEINRISAVHIGHQTEAFKAYADKDLEPLCFSIEYKDAQYNDVTLDLVCCRKADCMVWSVGLRTLKQDPAVQTIPLPVGNEPDMHALNMMYRSKWKSAARIGVSGTAAVVTFGTPLFLVGAPWLAYSLWTSRQTSDKAILAKMEEIKSYLADIKVILAEEKLKPHPYYPVAEARYKYIGHCYEDAARVTDYVLKNTKKQKYANVIQALAEAQALYWKVHILSVQSGANEGWFSGLFGSSEETKYNLGN